MAVLNRSPVCPPLIPFCRFLRTNCMIGMDIVDQFNNDPSIYIFLISTAAGGTGLNLTGTFIRFIVCFYDSHITPKGPIKLSFSVSLCLFINSYLLGVLTPSTPHKIPIGVSALKYEYDMTTDGKCRSRPGSTSNGQVCNIVMD